MSIDKIGCNYSNIIFHASLWWMLELVQTLQGLQSYARMLQRFTCCGFDFCIHKDSKKSSNKNSNALTNIKRFANRCLAQFICLIVDEYKSCKVADAIYLSIYLQSIISLNTITETKIIFPSLNLRLRANVK